MNNPVYWVEGRWAGRLAIVPRPRGGDWLEDEVASWKRAGIGVVVSLLTAEEIVELDLADEGRRCAGAMIELIAVPIPDRGVPRNLGDFTTALSAVERHLAAEQRVAVHCRQGVGRSALFSAALLMASGVDETEAWRLVEVARGCPVPDTSQQRHWISSVFLNAHRRRDT